MKYSQAVIGWEHFHWSINFSTANLSVRTELKVNFQIKWSRQSVVSNRWQSRCYKLCLWWYEWNKFTNLNFENGSLNFDIVTITDTFLGLTADKLLIPLNSIRSPKNLCATSLCLANWIFRKKMFLLKTFVRLLLFELKFWKYLNQIHVCRRKDITVGKLLSSLILCTN